jgi:hypothetical protein
MTLIIVSVIRGVTTLPLKENLAPRLTRVHKSNWVGAVTSMEGSRGSWIVGTPHVPTWLPLQRAHSIGSCRTE